MSLSPCRMLLTIAWISIGFGGGCATVNYFPIEVTAINTQTGQPQPGLMVRPNYNTAHGVAADEDWRTTDANGKAILPVTIDLTTGNRDASGNYYRSQAAPSIVIDNTNFYLKYGGWERMLDIKKLRRNTGVTDQAHPIHIKLEVDPHPPLIND